MMPVACGVETGGMQKVKAHECREFPAYAVNPGELRLIFEGAGRVFAVVLHYSVRHHAAHDFLAEIFIEETENLLRALRRIRGYEPVRDCKWRFYIIRDFDVVDVDPSPGFDYSDGVRARVQFEFGNAFHISESLCVRERDLTCGTPVHGHVLNLSVGIVRLRVIHI